MSRSAKPYKIHLKQHAFGRKLKSNVQKEIKLNYLLYSNTRNSNEAAKKCQRLPLLRWRLQNYTGDFKKKKLRGNMWTKNDLFFSISTL